MEQLLTTAIVVYFGIVLYDMLAQGSSPAAVLVWPLQSLSKAFAWLSKVDPNAATKCDLTNISQQVASYQQQSKVQITAAAVCTESSQQRQNSGAARTNSQSGSASGRALKTRLDTHSVTRMAATIRIESRFLTKGDRVDATCFGLESRPGESRLARRQPATIRSLALCGVPNPRGNRRSSEPDDQGPRSARGVLGIQSIEPGRAAQLSGDRSQGARLSAMFCYLTNQQECGCAGGDNGATIAGSVAAAGKEGVCEESLFPYTAAMAAGQYTDTIPAAATAEGKLHLVASHSVIHDYQTALQYLGTAGVIQIGIPVGDQFQNCSGPLTAQMVQKDARNPEGGHALAVVGYLEPSTIQQPAGDGRAWLIGQNSWGSDGWGAQGFFFIQPAAWDYLCKNITHGEVEIIGMSSLASFDDSGTAAQLGLRVMCILRPSSSGPRLLALAGTLAISLSGFAPDRLALRRRNPRIRGPISVKCRRPS